MVGRDFIKALLKTGKKNEGGKGNMTHGSLFSGIGGFDLAAEWMGWENVFHCEINPFCQKVLKYYWPNATSYTDIKTTDFFIHRGSVDIVTGGFPCQGFSIAGNRNGDIGLWKEMLRAVNEIKPRWVVAENVYGLLNIDHGLTAELVCSDLETIGYQKPIIFDCPNSAFGLPTMERHIWFISEAVSQRCKRGKKVKNQDNGNEGKLPRADQGEFNRWYLPESRFRDVGERVSKKLDKGCKQWLIAGGNAISPQVVYEIFKVIEQINQTT